MNKKANTLLFILGATLVNIIITMTVFILGLVLISNVLPDSAKESVGGVLFVVLFFVAIGTAFFAYNRFIKYLSNKIDMDKYFHPIFRPGGNKPGNKPEKKNE